MKFNVQRQLENERAILYPLQAGDFDALYAVARDPEIWKQHPSNDRWKKEVFTLFFESALESRSAFRIVDKATGKTAGSTRFHDYNEAENSIMIGYTFYGTAYWGTGMNTAVKITMLNYIFQFIPKVYFRVGSCNTRSQIAVSRLGAQKMASPGSGYPGEAPTDYFLYLLERETWTVSLQNILGYAR